MCSFYTQCVEVIIASCIWLKPGVPAIEIDNKTKTLATCSYSAIFVVPNKERK